MEKLICSKEVPAKIPRIAVYLEESLKEIVAELAKEERRSLSQMCGILIEEAAQARASGNTQTDVGNKRQEKNQNDKDE